MNEYDDATKSKVGIDAELEKIFDAYSKNLFPIGLVWYNRFTSLLHLIVAVLILIVNLNDNNTHDLTTVTTKTLHTWVGAGTNSVLPVRNFGPNPRDLSVNITINNNDRCIMPGDHASRSASFKIRELTVEVASLDIRWVMFVFFIVSVVFQLPSTFPQAMYKRQLKLGKAHRSHLFEYSISASLMMMAMCAQVGVTDIYILLNVFSNTFACMIFGLLSDVLSDANEEKRMVDEEEVNVMGCKRTMKYSIIAHLAGWFTLAIALSVMVSNIVTFQQCVSGISMPTEIIFVICLEVFLFVIFGCIQVYTLLYKKCTMTMPRTLTMMKWYVKLKNNATVDAMASQVAAIEAERLQAYIVERKEYIERQTERIATACQAERAYITLSLFAKLFLGGIVYISAVIRSN